jgi:E3 ubiquitin-protein ligase synoviolin
METDGEDPNAPATSVESTPKTPDVATKSQDEDDDDLAAMMAFQAEQEPVESDDPVHDDPNIVFLQDDNDDDAADELEPDEHPNQNNPAAVALRARLQRHRQGLALAQQMQNRPLIRRILSGIFRMRYAPLSFLAAFLLIVHTMRTRQQFYLTVIYLQSSKLSYIVLGNAVIACGVSTFSIVTKLFLDGGLRVNERDAIGEHIRWDVTETCLALTIFRSELDVKTAIMFLGLVIMKW